MRFSTNLVLHTIGENVVNNIRVFRMKMAVQVAIIEDSWRPLRDSNPEPEPYEGTALSFELRGPNYLSWTAPVRGFCSSLKSSFRSWTRPGPVLAVPVCAGGGLLLRDGSKPSIAATLGTLTKRLLTPEFKTPLGPVVAQQGTFLRLRQSLCGCLSDQPTHSTKE